jgi:hypothetical protein
VHTTSAMKRTTLVGAAMVFSAACATDVGVNDALYDDESADTDDRWTEDGDGSEELLELPGAEGGLQQPGNESGDASTILATGNLLTNGGFETGREGFPLAPYSWARAIGYMPPTCLPPYQGCIQYAAAESYDTYVYRTRGGYAGSYALRVRSDSALYSFANAAQAITPVPGRSYTLRAMTRRRSGDQQMLTAGFYDANSKLIKRFVIPTGWSTSWHKLTKTFTAPAGATYLAVYLGDAATMAWFYGSVHDWDSVSLVAN